MGVHAARMYAELSGGVHAARMYVELAPTSAFFLNVLPHGGFFGLVRLSR